MLPIMAIQRQIEFEGNDTAYIRFLENKVLELENVLQTLPNQRIRPSVPQSVRAGSNPRSSRRQSSTNERGNRPTVFQAIEYDPNHDDCYPKRVKSRSQTRDRWQSDLNGLLAKVPPLDYWRSHKKELSEKSRITLEVLAQADISLYQTPIVPPRTYSGPVDLVPILHQYCNFAMKTSPEGDFYCKLTCFRELVFMSFCAVALKVADNAASVFKVMREYSGSETQEKHLIKLTRGAIWANRSIFALSGTQWGSDCSDVFLLGKSEQQLIFVSINNFLKAGQPVSFYARYAEYSESLPYFLHQMRTKAGDHASSGKDSRPVSLAVPLIIERLARGSLS